MTVAVGAGGSGADLGTRVAAVLVAAGSGERLGLGRPKALVEVAGRPLVAWAVSGLRAAGVATVVVVHPSGQRDAFAGALAGEGAAAGDGGVVAGDGAVSDAGDGGPAAGSVVLVSGGADRSASVRAGVAALPDDVEVVAIHDAARAFTPPTVIRTALEAVTGDVVAAAPAVPVADTLKRISGDQVVRTVDRADLVAIQTPQVLPRTVLDVVAADRASATDDLGLVEAAIADRRLEGRVVWVPGSPRGFKVTFPEDLALAEAFAAGASPA